MEYLRTHHPSDNGIADVAAAIHRSVTHTRYTIYMLESEHRVIVGKKKYGNKRVFLVVGSKEHQAQCEHDFDDGRVVSCLHCNYGHGGSSG